MCEFVTQRRVIEPTYTSLAPGVFVVEGYPNLYFASLDGFKTEACGNETILEHCNPCLITMDCGCMLKQKGSGRTDKTVIQHNCVGNLTENTVLYAVNLIILEHFYQLTNVSVDGKTLLARAEELSIKPITWPLFGDNVTKQLTADEEKSYSLGKLVSELQNGSTSLYHSASEALLAQYIDANSPGEWMGINRITLNTGLIVGILIIAIIALLGTVRNHIMLQRLCKASCKILAMALVPQTKAIELRPLATTSPEVSKNFTTILDTLLNHLQNEDYLQWVVIGILMGFIVIMILRLWRLSRRLSYVYIQISTNSGMEMLRVGRMPDASRQYIIRCLASISLTATSHCFFGHITYIGAGLILVHRISGKEIMLPTRIRIAGCKIRRYQWLFNDSSCVITPVVVHSHEYVCNQITTQMNERVTNPDE